MMDNVMAPQAVTRSADHRYTFCPVHIMEGCCPLDCVTPKVTVPGVTSILDVLDKSGPLMAWAARQTAEAAVRMAMSSVGVDHVTALDELVSSVGPEGAIRALTSRANWQRDEAAQLGTEVHRLAEGFIRGESDAHDLGRPEGIRERIRHYAEWWSDSGWKLRLSEAMIVNPEWSYGGTFDLLATDQDGRTVLVDIKTGGKVNRKAYESEVLQLAAYGAFNGTMVQAPDGKAYPMPHVDRFTLLHLTLDGLRVIDVSVGAREMSAFSSCLDLADWKGGLRL